MSLKYIKTRGHDPAQCLLLQVDSLNGSFLNAKDSIQMLMDIFRLLSWQRMALRILIQECKQCWTEP